MRPPGGVRSARRARLPRPCPTRVRRLRRAPRWPAIPGPPSPPTPPRRSRAARPARRLRRRSAAARCRCRITGPGQRAHDRPRPHARPQRIVPGQPIEQRGRRGAQRLLIGREVEVHGGAVYGPSLTSVSPVAAAVPCCGRWICTPPRSRNRCAKRSGPGSWSTSRGPTGSGCRPASTTWPRRSRSGGNGRPTWPPTAGSASRGPSEYGGRGLGRARELRRHRGAGAGAGPRARRPHRDQPGRAHAAGLRDAGAEGALPPTDPLGRRALVPALQRARRRERPGVAHDTRRPGRRRVPGERPQGVDVVRAVRRLGTLPHPHRPGRRPNASSGSPRSIVDMHAAGVARAPARAVDR